MLRPLLNCLLLTTLAAGEGYLPPTAPFVTSPDEQLVPVVLSAGPTSAAQTKLQAARQEHPDAVLLVTLDGPLTITDQPLQLGSKTVLNLTEGAALVAADNATADCLLRIDGAELVAVNGTGFDPATLDGRGRNLTGVLVTASGRVHLDHLAVRGCARAVSFTGRGAERSDPGTLVRSQAVDCSVGLAVQQSAQFACLDNQFAVQGTAMELDSHRAVVIGNTVRGGGTGLLVHSTGLVAARNQFRDVAVGVELPTGADEAYLTQNRFLGAGLALRIAGATNAVYRNTIATDQLVELTGPGNVLTQNVGLSATDVPAGNVYFNPPTFDHPHTDPVIASGLGRFDLEVQGTKQRSFSRWESQPETEREPLVPLSQAQRALDAAVKAHPNDIVVATLHGLFTADATFDVPANVSVILDGEVRAVGTALDSRAAEDPTTTQLVKLGAKGFGSLSGGIWDAAFLPYHGVNAPGKNIGVIDGVTIKRAGFNGLTTKFHGGLKQPLFIHGCTVVDSGNRGIWVHVTRNVHLLECTSAGNISDGIDFDAYGHDSTALFNVCTGNRRHGVFIEEGVQHDLAYGNRLAENLGNGVHVWNEAVKGNTGGNLILCNDCWGNSTGISAGGRAADKTSHDNWYFNNRCYDNRRAGVVYGNKYSSGNYFGQNAVWGNPEPVLNWTGGPLELWFSSGGR